jgi:hypothetical protein
LKGQKHLMRMKGFILLLGNLLAARYYLDKAIAWTFRQSAKSGSEWIKTEDGKTFLKALWEDSPENYIKMLNQYAKACGMPELEVSQKANTIR